MATRSYTVESDRLVGYVKGSTVSVEDLGFPDTAIDALVAAGHLSEAKATASSKQKGDD